MGAVVRVVMELTAGAFVGACVYILVVQHPVRMALSGSGPVEEFRASIPRAGDDLVRWGRLHAVRTVVALLGAVALLL